MERFSPTGKVSKKQVHNLRWTTFLGRTVGILVEWIAPLVETTTLGWTANRPPNPTQSNPIRHPILIPNHMFGLTSGYPPPRGEMWDTAGDFLER